MAIARMYDGSGSPGSSGMKGQFIVSLYHAATDKRVPGVTLNLQRGTLTADCDGYFNRGDLVTVELRLQDAKPPLTVSGRIADRHAIPATHHHAMAVEFVELSSQDAGRIDTAVEEGISDLARFFREFPLFAEFAPEDAHVLSACCHRHFIARKHIFFRKGGQFDRLDGLFIVRRGMVQIYRQVTRLREEKIALASVGEVFGELSLVLTQPHSASIRAVNDSELIEISRETYNQLKTKHEKVAMKLMDVMLKVLAKRLGRTTKMLFSPIRIR
ncbi:MAG TPA: cyclic nucleotide-binding domain-containing protein [Planctomycetota bacterium]|nr:cyclic nucleotide-binding domain-containing protein [Planctomycetota bacterium]